MRVGMAPIFQNPLNERTDDEVYTNEVRLADLAEPLRGGAHQPPRFWSLFIARQCP